MRTLSGTMSQWAWKWLENGVNDYWNICGSQWWQVATNVHGEEYVGICSVGSCGVVCLDLSLEELRKSRGSPGTVDLAVDTLVCDKMLGTASSMAWTMFSLPWFTLDPVSHQCQERLQSVSGNEASSTWLNCYSNSWAHHLQRMNQEYIWGPNFRPFATSWIGRNFLKST